MASLIGREMPPALPGAAGVFTLERVPGFDREQWTTCYIQRLEVGDILTLPGSKHLVPLILTGVATEEIPGDTWGITTGALLDPETGENTAFKVRANTSVLTRRDTYYRRHDGGQP